jgi:small subunit ribosomal protein S6
MAKAKKQKAADNALTQYEAMFLLGAAATAEPEKGVETCRGIIERHGGQIMVIKKWDERKLAYEISGQKRGTKSSAFSLPPRGRRRHRRDVSWSEEVGACWFKADHLNIDEMKAVEPQPIQAKRPAGMSSHGHGRSRVAPSNFGAGADRNRPRP